MGVFVMPSLGSDMESGTLVEWTIKPGDTVKRGDVVAVVETQKGAIEIEIFEDGTVSELTAELGRELPVGAPLAVILKPGEVPPAPPSPPKAQVSESSPASARGLDPVPVASDTAPPLSPPRATHPDASAVSPAARVRARERGLDLGTLSGSGPGGAILLRDVDAAEKAAAIPTSNPLRTGSPIAEMRKAIAAAMTRAKQTIPHFYLSETIDVQPAINFLAERNADRLPAERVLLGALFVQATARSAAKVKSVNGRYADGAFQPSSTVNVGVVVALRGGGLVAPALMDVRSLDLDQTMAGMRDLVSRARAGRLRSSEMTEGTITLSSLGETGAEAMTGVIFPPQVALVGIGAPHIRPWVVGGAVVPRSVVTLTISADHRVSDGRQVARFITEFETLMQDPENL
ncbi:MAG: dihydrolipoamide acetyltransferase family protein [Dinoroseobacter sp.]|nr:dihydrolipoamide acetyltransferase family protein [Dinoroseobacter sp.]